MPAGFSGGGGGESWRQGEVTLLLPPAGPLPLQQSQSVAEGAEREDGRPLACLGEEGTSPAGRPLTCGKGHRPSEASLWKWSFSQPIADVGTLPRRKI